MVRPYVPDVGDIVWLNFDPQAYLIHADVNDCSHLRQRLNPQNSEEGFLLAGTALIDPNLPRMELGIFDWFWRSTGLVFRRAKERA